MPIELERVFYAYPSFNNYGLGAVNGLTLKIDEKEFVGIMGHTGCGKTTLLQLIAGLLSPTDGRILLNGEDIGASGYDRRKLRQTVGIVFQYPEYQLFERTVERDVAFGLKHSGLSSAEVSQRVNWALNVMGLDAGKIAQKSPLALSGGEKRRVAIAGVLVSKPKYLLFDEPIAGLDPIARTSFLQTVSKLCQEGTAIVMVSHNADALGEYAQRLVVIDEGRVVKDANTAQVFLDVKGLRALGLDASTPRVIADMLLKRGVPMPPDTVKYEELLNHVKQRFCSNPPMKGGQGGE